MINTVYTYHNKRNNKKTTQFPVFIVNFSQLTADKKKQFFRDVYQWR